jgi:hypothetical protein
MRYLIPQLLPVLLVFSLFGAPAGAAPPEEMEIARLITASQVPLEKLPEAYRQKVRDVLDQSTSIYSRSNVAAFPCKPAVYHWLVENPHWGFKAWKALGSKCATVELKDDGCFLGTDSSGSDFKLYTVYREPGRRIWYAEGMAKPTVLSPPVSVRAVLLLKYQEVKGIDGRIGIRQRAELFAQVDTKSAGLLAKLWGLSAEAITAKAVEQVDLFFSGMSWYITEHPAWAKTTLQPTNTTPVGEVKQIEAMLQEIEAR